MQQHGRLAKTRLSPNAVRQGGGFKVASKAVPL